MKRISKMDYYAGAFIASIINSAKGAPALFDETSDSRKLQIATNLGDFNIYIKYSANPRNAQIRGRKKKSWHVNFTQTDMQKLENEFVQDNCKNYVALVLSDKRMLDTKIAVLAYDDAMKLLAKWTPGGSRGINVVRYGSEHSFKCYGATEQEKDGLMVNVNHMKYFDASINGEEEESE
jgi:hypothetical protein